jgi:hypothetical protein
MTDGESSNDPVAISNKARDEIETVRKNLQRLCGELAMTNDSAKEIARNELCKALVQRLELAEREALELVELIVSTQKSSKSSNG